MSNLKEQLLRFKVQALQRLKRSERVLNIAEEALGAFTALRNPDQPKAITAMNVLLGGVKAGVTRHGILSEHEWMQLDDVPSGIVRSISDVLNREHGERAVRSRSDGSDVTIYRVGKFMLVVVLSSWYGGNKIMIPRHHETGEYINFIAEMIWRYFGTRVKFSSSSKMLEMQLNAVTSPAMPSARALALADRTKSFIAKGERRSILLYGIPGTGKSCAARYIADQIGGLTAWIDAQDLYNLPEEVIDFTAAALRPKVIIVDDIDRAKDSRATALRRLETVGSTIEVMIATANHVNWLDDAAIRPGRFSEVVKFDQLEREIAEGLLGGLLPTTIIDQVLNWPVAFIEELRTRAAVLGPEIAMAEFPGLAARVRHNRLALSEPNPETTKGKKVRAIEEPETEFDEAEIVEEIIYTDESGKEINIDDIAEEQR